MLQTLKKNPCGHTKQLNTQQWCLTSGQSNSYCFLSRVWKIRLMPEDTTKAMLKTFSTPAERESLQTWLDSVPLPSPFWRGIQWFSYSTSPSAAFFFFSFLKDPNLCLMAVWQTKGVSLPLHIFVPFSGTSQWITLRPLFTRPSWHQAAARR